MECSLKLLITSVFPSLPPHFFCNIHAGGIGSRFPCREHQQGIRVRKKETANRGAEIGKGKGQIRRPGVPISGARRGHGFQAGPAPGYIVETLRNRFVTWRSRSDPVQFRPCRASPSFLLTRSRRLGILFVYGGKTNYLTVRVPKSPDPGRAGTSLA